jgi:hypothetical protein
VNVVVVWGLVYQVNKVDLEQQNRTLNGDLVWVPVANPASLGPEAVVVELADYHGRPGRDLWLVEA